MGASERALEPRPNSIKSYDKVDFIRDRMKTLGITIRPLAELTGIKRGRLHNILHGTPEKRTPIKITEVDLILRVIGSAPHEAALAVEIAQFAEDGRADAKCRVFSMLAVAMKGLAGRLASTIDHIEGLDSHDIRDEHGALIQEAIVQLLERHYGDIVRRRDASRESLLNRRY